ncbi:hypothetical protein LGT39_05840 [Demequina sp. TTPB684]|uniref:hypothetical protein n=1 Tax=unclassified Demequina TaxID=2620311 RepID=UPI001CF54AB8|nr:MULTISPECIES: hypothetical protein [unclassified Demequina]MCB2412369.1 hypothetical protein [Demequina sp. TTPB684]UPU89039.1 hypothetical protein LGT36_003695 [Demequina sp. TMPB413]
MTERRTADGYVLTKPQVAALEAIEQRLRWPSLHWDTERVHKEAWPHIARAAADAAIAAAADVPAVFGELAEFAQTTPYTAKQLAEGIMHWARVPGITPQMIALIVDAYDLDKAPGEANTVTPLPNVPNGHRKPRPGLMRVLMIPGHYVDRRNGDMWALRIVAGAERWEWVNGNRFRFVPRTHLVRCRFPVRWAL